MSKLFTLSVISFFLLFVLPVSAQQNTIAAGGNVSTASGSICYSIGNLDFVSIEGPSGGLVNQGLQQPIEIFDITEVTPLQSGVLVHVFPNPTTEILTIESKEAITWSLSDLNGRNVAESNTASNENQLHVGKLASGSYFLRVKSGSKTHKTFKINKN